MRSGEIALQRNEAGLTVLTISGEHDLSTAPDLRRRLSNLISEGSPVVVDLSGATFVDSSILGAILSARHDADATGMGFAVAHPGGDGAVGRVLEITGLRKELPVHSSREEATSAARDGLRGAPT